MKWLRTVLSSVCLLGVSALLLVAGTQPSAPNAGMITTPHTSSLQTYWYPGQDEETMDTRPLQ